MLRFIEAGETIRYRLKKNKSMMLYIIIYVPIWLLIGSLFLIPLYEAFFMGETDWTPFEYYLMGMIGLIVFIPLAVAVILSYFLNQIIITDKRIYIRRGITGRTQILNMNDICAFRYVFHSAKYYSNKRVFFYLHCGKVIKTADLYVRPDSLNDMLGLLRERFEDRELSDEELEEMKRRNAGAGQVATTTNYLVLLMHFAPFILALALTINHLYNI